MTDSHSHATHGPATTKPFLVIFTLLCVFTASEKISASTSTLGKCVPFVSIFASAMQALINSFASSRSRIEKSR